LVKKTITILLLLEPTITYTADTLGKAATTKKNCPELAGPMDSQSGA